MKIENEKKILENSLMQLEHQLQALMHKAYNGELSLNLLTT
jgi:hypothetical protein